MKFIRMIHNITSFVLADLLYKAPLVPAETILHFKHPDNSKVFEKKVYGQLYDYLEKNSLLCINQFQARTFPPP